LSAYYRFYLLQTDDHIARRREDYFADDAAAIAAAGLVIGDYPGIEIWCERRKVVTLSNQGVARLQPSAARRPPNRAALLISRNKHLLQQAANTRRRTHALCARPSVGRVDGRERTGGRMEILLNDAVAF
jgi:hypothetical protein